MNNGRKRRFNEVNLPQTPDLTLHGAECKIYRDDRLAQSIQGGNHLIDWCRLHDETPYQAYGDTLRDNSVEPFWMERHDARILLDELSMQRTCEQRRTKIDHGLNSSLHQFLGQFLENKGKYEDEALDDQRYGLLPGLASFDKGGIDCTKSTSTDAKARLEDAQTREIEPRKQQDDDEVFQLTKLELENMSENITTLVSESKIIQNVWLNISKSTEDNIQVQEYDTKQ
mmetsp:Transcript_9186/g.19607  ORF Transcript_9186/g.19607 Transcript_9186/m.19607 type:complete len:228 (+) Transcript_9186:300-983(+)